MKKTIDAASHIPDFWAELPRPFFVLAPMANVTDSVFRKLIAKYGKPDVMWTEFVSADGLASPEGRKRLLPDLAFGESERPIVAQLFTGHPEAMKQAAELVRKLGFDGLDINMGCPDRAVMKQGGGASLIRNPDLAIKVIEAAREGAGPLPVSVKARIGFNKIDLEWIRTLLAVKLPALSVHLRTCKELSAVPAHWELIPDIVKLRDEASPQTLIIGNGDIETPAQAAEFARKFGCDGIMIGRGIFGKPWLFENLAKLRKKGENPVATAVYAAPLKTPRQKLDVLVEHAKLFERTFKGLKSFDVMKKHFKAYVSGWDGAKELRAALMTARDAGEVKKIIERG
ncbi:MAG: hypothetical protein QOG91_281 [Candidatus Parcubacteria bacterium]|jgi:nifR3 family TIM-barrel protein|nr:hypothetical protein [Candidatus Parcubacteria bacterium]